MGLLIQDGYIFDGSIQAFASFPEIKFRYRPALAEDIDEYVSVEKTSGKERVKHFCDFLQKHLISWDIRDDKEETVPITLENLRRLPYRLHPKFINVVTGYSDEEQAKDIKN